MFREMRRSRQALSREEIIEILENGETCVMAVSGDNDYPYAVPLNYVYSQGKIYFHGAVEGHKIDAIKRNDKVSLCVIARADVTPKEMATDFISVIAFGRARILNDDEEKMYALKLIGDRFSWEFPEEVKAEIESEWDRVTLVEISIESMTGKVGKALVDKLLNY